MTAVDIETDDPHLKQWGPGSIRNDGEIIGVGLYNPAGLKGFYAYDSEEVKSVLANSRETKVFHNGVYDLDWLINWGHLKVEGLIEDTMTRETLLDAYKFSYQLDSLCLAHGIAGKNKGDTIDAWWEAHGGKGKAVTHLKEMPRDIVGQYCVQDCVATYNLYMAQQPLLEQEELLYANNIEARLYPALMKMRSSGFRLDWNARSLLSDKLNDEYDTGMEELERDYGIMNLNAATDLARAWKKAGIPIVYTETGRPSFASAVLDDCEHPVAQKVKHLRGLYKLLSTFIDGGFVDESYNGRIYSTFYPAKRDEGGTVTGRWSSQHINLQQIPAREDKHGTDVRSLFIPEDGCTLGAFDYKQIEYRVFTHFAIASGAPGAEHVREQYQQNPNLDFHAMGQHLMGWDNMGKAGRHLTKNFGFTCMAPDNYIATRRGYIKCRDLLPNDKLVMGTGNWRAFIGRKEQYRFTLSNGQQFCVTTDHPFKHNGARDIKEGDVFPITPCHVWGNLQTIIMFHRHEKTGYITITPDVAYMLGVWLGDGSLHYQYKTGEPSAISFCTPPENTELLQTIVGGKITIAQRGDKWTIWMVTDKMLATFIKEHCGTTTNKHVPDVIYRSPREVVIAFMTGFLDSDGTVHNNHPQLVNTNEQLMRGLARLAAMLGWEANWLSEPYKITVPKQTKIYAGVLYRLQFRHTKLLLDEFQGVVRQWSCREFRHRNVFVVKKEYIGEQDTWCMSVDPPHWYEAECCINHNSLYGLGPKSFAERFKQSLLAAHPDTAPGDLLKLAKRLMEEYALKVPFVRGTANDIQATGRRRGYVKTISGRRQRMPPDSAAYKLVNYLVQGSAADILKKALVDAWEQGVFDVLTPHAAVHDELVFSIPNTKPGVEAALQLQKCMQNAYELTVPTGVDTEVGPDWGHCNEDNFKQLLKEVEI